VHADTTILSARTHLYEYLAELVGTALLVCIGFSTGAVIFGTSLVSHWLPGTGPRLFLAGLCFGGGGTLVTLSPLGRRSGAHLNPSVTITFFLLNRMHRRDFVGYLAAQFAGAAVGAVLAALVATQALRAIHFDLTRPGTGVHLWQAMLTEFIATGLLIGTILLFVSFQRTARLTPFAVWLLVATLVWQTARISGTSLNPARSFGSAVLAWFWQDQWIYFVAPSLAGVVVALGYRWIVGEQHLVTAKLFHPFSHTLRCHFRDCNFCAQRDAHAMSQTASTVAEPIHLP
jgi:aquaporin Z